MDDKLLIIIVFGYFLNLMLYKGMISLFIYVVVCLLC